MTAPSRSLKELFLEALEIAPADRSAWLERECPADAGLREQLGLLLAAHDAPQSLLDRPGQAEPMAGLLHSLTDSLTVDPPVTEKTGTQIGPYKLLQQIGEGGMGVVYMAEQLEPVKRRVALKIIKPGMDTRQVIARFEAERQALSLMDHPNIAKVLDAGATECGRPYFVMELVKGQAITDYCEEHHLAPRERLELFLPICQAIQHAHQKGIIHRDIKPTNILIAEYDQQPVPKVIDFGVAKATSQVLTEKTMFTGLGQIVGTLEYMSPEQAKVNQLDIDTRSDVYSLGVVLYELLTGSTPLDKRRLQNAAWDEMLRIIREEEPPKPSTRLSDLSNPHTLCKNGAARTVPLTLDPGAALRRIEAAKLMKLIRGELDWIVMKALEKDRNRRYETAAGFGEDVQRYLSDEPVAACPPSVRYRLWKFARRNFGVLAASTLIAVVLLTGTAISVWQAVRATKAEATATLEARRANRETQRAREQETLANTNASETDQQRVLAEQNFRKAQEAVDQMLTRVASDLLPFVPQMEQLRRDLYEDALKFNQHFLNDNNTNPAVREETGRAYDRLGNIYRFLGQYQQCEEAHRKAINLFERLLAEFPENRTYREGYAHSKYELAVLLRSIDRSAEAEDVLAHVRSLYEQLHAESPAVPAYRRNLADTYQNLGHTLAATDRVTEREAAYSNGLELYEQLAAEFPQEPEYRFGTAKARSALGVVLREVGRLQAAEISFRQAIQSYELLVADFPNPPIYRQDRGTAFHGLGLVLVKAGRPLEAEQVLQRAVADYEKLAVDFPAIPFHRRSLANYSNHLAGVLETNERFDEAETFYRKTAALLGKLATEFPDSLSERKALATVRARLGTFLAKLNRDKEAETEFRNAIGTRIKLAADFEDLTENRQSLARLRLTLGNRLRNEGRQTEAETELREAIDVLRALVSDDLASERDQVDLATTHLNLSDMLAKSGRAQEAEDELRAGIAGRSNLALDFPDKLQYRISLANDETGLGRLLTASGQLPEAEQAHRRAITHWEHVVAIDQHNPSYRATLGSRKNLHRSALQAIGHSAEAEQAAREALKLFERLAAEFPAVADYRYQLAVTYTYLAVDMLRAGTATDAEAAYQQSLRLLEGVSNEVVMAATYRSTLADLHGQLGAHFEVSGRLEEARNAYGQAITIYEQLVSEAPTNTAYHRKLAANCNTLAWFLATRSDLPGRDADRAVALARRSVNLLPKDARFWKTLGFAQYRAKEWESAIASLQTAEMLAPRKNLGFNGLFLAMAEWQCGHTLVARQWYDQATAWMEKNPSQDEAFKRFGAEAAELLKFTDKPNPK